MPPSPALNNLMKASSVSNKYRKNEMSVDVKIVFSSSVNIFMEGTCIFALDISYLTLKVLCLS